MPTDRMHLMLAMGFSLQILAVLAASRIAERQWNREQHARRERELSEHRAKLIAKRTKQTQTNSMTFHETRNDTDA